jgi:phosphoesterase RecJ-like protein
MEFGQPQIDKTIELLAAAKNILISTHKNPDGDAIGSSTALYHLLTASGKKCKILLPDAAPQSLQWMLKELPVLVYETNPDKVKNEISSFDLIIIADYNHLGRVGKELEAILSECHLPAIMIDHHQQPAEFPVVRMIDTKACSTCELVYRFAKLCGMESLLNLSSAASIYSGIVTDTGSFRFDSVKPETHRIVAHLMEMGIDHAAIHREIYDTNSPERMRLVGYSISKKLQINESGSTAWIWLDAEELNAHAYQQGDAEGLVNQALSINGVKLAAFFREAKGEIKTSFRSKGKFDVNSFARKYWQGGGHFHAAGGSSALSMKETLEKFEQLIKEHSEEINHS